LAAALLEREIVDGREVDEIIGRSAGGKTPAENAEPSPTK
jgi:hypothetical protein